MQSAFIVTFNLNMFQDTALDQTSCIQGIFTSVKIPIGMLHFGGVTPIASISAVEKEWCLFFCFFAMDYSDFQLN